MMLLSSKRIAVALCTVAIFITLTVYEAVQKNSAYNSLSSPHSSLILNYSSLTTDKESPRFAYAQYATDINYLCNTVQEKSALGNKWYWSLMSLVGY